MNILIVANGYPPSAVGGVEVYSQGIARGLAARSHRVTVFCRESQNDRPDYEVDDSVQDGVRVIRVVNDFKNIRAFEETYTSGAIDDLFYSLVSQLQPEIVHINHLIGLSANLPEIAASVSVPQVISLHDFWYLCARVNFEDWRGQPCGGPRKGGDCYRCVTGSSRWLRLRARILSAAKPLLGARQRRRLRDWGWLPSASSVTASAGTREDFALRYRRFASALSKSKTILAPSDFVATAFRANGLENLAISVLPLGIQPFEPTDSSHTFPQSIHLGFVGPLIPAKGLDVLLEAMGRIDDPRLRLLAFGRDDVDAAFTRRIVRRSGRDGRVRLMGPFQPADRDRVYGDLDLVVIPSRVPESFSLVAREALNAGKPVLAASVGALPEVIQPGVNGDLFLPSDPQSLAEKLRLISENPEALHRMNVGRTADIPSVEEHIDKLQSVYDAAAGRGRAGQAPKP